LNGRQGGKAFFYRFSSPSILFIPGDKAFGCFGANGSEGLGIILGFF
jgi:hypothetical protein